jgi:hypothetical protein
MFSTLLTVWRFEDQPASGRSPEAIYLEGVSTSHVVIFLAGSDTSDATAAEVSLAIAEGKDILCLILPAESRTERVTELIRRVREHGTTKDVAADEKAFRIAVYKAVHGWLAERIIAAPTQNRRSRLRALRNESHERMVQSWLSVGLSEGLSRQFATDPSVGSPPPDALSTEHTFHILVAPGGSGKSLATERLLQIAIDNAELDVLSPIPVRLASYSIIGSLRAAVDAALAGLGDLSLNGVYLCIDALDEVDEARSRQLLEEAWVLHAAYSRSRVILASRHLPPHQFLNYVIHIPPLSMDNVKGLIERTSGTRTDIVLQHASEAVLESCRRPLFALILAQDESNSAKSESELADFLIARSLSRTERIAAAGEALQRLASGILDSPDAAVPSTSFTVLEQVELLKSRLVMEDRGNFRIPLRIIAERAASQWLLRQPQDVAIEKTRPNELADRWKIPLIDYIRKLNDNDAQGFIRSIAAYDPAFSYELAKADNGNRIEPWSIHTLQAAIDASRNALTYAFARLYEGRIETLSVQSLSDDSIIIFRTTYAPSGSIKTTTRYLGRGHIGPRRHSPFLFVMARVVELINHNIAVRGLTIDNYALRQEELWNQARALIGHGTLCHDALLLREVSERLAILPSGLVFAADSGATHVAVDTDELRRHIEMLESNGDTAWPPPFVPGDQQGAQWVWSVYSPDALLRKRRQVLSSAMQSYEIMVDQWLPSLSSRLRKRAIMPAIIHERIFFSSDGEPLQDGYWLPTDSENSVEIELAEISHLDQPFPSMEGSDEEHGHHPRRGTPESIESGIIRMWGPWPIRETIYQWLIDDLRELALTTYIALPNDSN